MKELIDFLNNENELLANRIDFFYDFINEKAGKDWNRGDIYIVVETLLNHYKFEDRIMDEIYEFKTSLIGDAAPASIFRFKDDPKDENDLVSYVRSGIWKNLGDKSY